MSFLSKDKNEKDKKLTSDSIRVRIYRLVNNLPSEIAVLNAEFKKDKYNNSLVIDNDSNFKEEFPSVVDSLISDVLYKLNSYGLSTEDQLDKVRKNIKKKEQILSKVKNGKLLVKYKDGKKEDVEININVETEKSNLRLLKCVEYTLVNKRSNGSFEKIEQDGTRCLSYVVREGELIPYYHNTPTSNSEPITLIPDISLRKKYFYDNEVERLQDLRDVENNNISGILKTITLALVVLVALGNIGWTIYLARWSGDMHDENLQPQIDKLKVDNERIKQECTRQLSSQVMNNGVLIDWAKLSIQQEINSINKTVSTDRNNVNI